MNIRRTKLPRSIHRIAVRNKAQPRASERHPAHVSVSNNKWLLFKDPEFWGDLLCTSEWIHLISGVPIQKNYQWQSQVMAPDLWLNCITCFTPMLAMAGHEHFPGSCFRNWVNVGRGRIGASFCHLCFLPPSKACQLYLLDKDMIA